MIDDLFTRRVCAYVSYIKGFRKTFHLACQVKCLQSKVKEKEKLSSWLPSVNSLLPSTDKNKKDEMGKQREINHPALRIQYVNSFIQRSFIKHRPPHPSAGLVPKELQGSRVFRLSPICRILKGCKQVTTRPSQIVRTVVNTFISAPQCAA